MAAIVAILSTISNRIMGTNVRILGSLHMFPRILPALPTWVEGAYQWAEDLIVESEPNPTTFLPFTRLPVGDRLSNHLSPALVASIHAFWAASLSRSDFEQMKPWTAWISFMGRLLDLAPGVELQLLPRARVDLKGIFELETIGEVPGLLDMVPDHVIEDALQYSVADTGRMRATCTATHAAWVARDGAEVYRLASSVPSYHSELGDTMIRERSSRWIPRLVPAFGTGRRTLVMVGTAHLFGAGGLTAGLQVASGRLRNQLP